MTANISRLFPILIGCVLIPTAACGQQTEVAPDINAPFRKPDVAKWVERFERNEREVVQHLKQIVAACGLKPGMSVADIGAATGVFTRPMARQVGPQGKVYAVEISQEFVDHLVKSSRKAGLQNVVGILGKDRTTTLARESLDVVFVCDTYHHFEYPADMLADIHRALRPGGRLIVVDYEREEGKSSEWVLDHVRAGKEMVIEEVAAAGFRLIDEPVQMEENYCLRFEKVTASSDQSD